MIVSSANTLTKCSFIGLLMVFRCGGTAGNSSEALWTDLIAATHHWSQTVADQLRINFESLAKDNNISDKCYDSVQQWIDGLAKLDNWAHQMYNSWSKFPPPGLLEGTSSDLGAYDQCLSVEPNERIGRSQYCMLDLGVPVPRPQPIHHNLNHQIDVLPVHLTKNQSHLFHSLSKKASFFYWISIRTTICVPHKCGLQDITKLTKQFAAKYGLESQSIRCESRQTVALNNLQLFACMLIGIFVICGVTASVAEYWMPVKKKSFFVQIFSISKSLKKLLSPQTSENLSCLHGIRVLTIFWVIFGHTIVWVHFQTFSRTFRIKDILTNNVNQLVLNVEYGVDTIFFISGLLTTYITLSITQGKIQHFNCLGYLLSRIIRLSPQMFIFLVINFLLPLMGSGPVWRESIDKLMDRCYDNWWLNLLYVQNFVKVDNMCAHHTWYMACDMQFHFISIIIILAFLRNIRMGIVVNAITISLFIGISAVIVYVYNLPPAIVNTGRDQYFQDYYVELFYYKPWPHAIIFFMGIAFGVVVYKRQFFILQRRNFYLVWALVLAGFWIPLMDDWFWNEGQPYNRLVSAFYYPMCRLVWSLCIALMIWLCLSGNGGLVNRFLSWKPFVPLARLTYSVYLTHAWIVWIFYGTRRERIDLSNLSLLLIFLHNLVLSYAVGMAFALIFEMPILRINKYLLKYFGPTKDSELQLRSNEPYFTKSIANNNLIVAKTTVFDEEQQTTL